MCFHYFRHQWRSVAHWNYHIRIWPGAVLVSQINSSCFCLLSWELQKIRKIYNKPQPYLYSVIGH